MAIVMDATFPSGKHVVMEIEEGNRTVTIDGVEIYNGEDTRKNAEKWMPAYQEAQHGDPVDEKPKPKRTRKGTK
jgi:hypothetical protein